MTAQNSRGNLFLPNNSKLNVLTCCEVLLKMHLHMDYWTELMMHCILRLKTQTKTEEGKDGGRENLQKKGEIFPSNAAGRSSNFPLSPRWIQRYRSGTWWRWWRSGLQRLISLHIVEYSPHHLFRLNFGPSQSWPWDVILSCASCSFSCFTLGMK